MHRYTLAWALACALAGCGGGGGDCPALSIDMQSLAAQAARIDLEIFDATVASCDGNDVAAGAPKPRLTGTLQGHDGTTVQLPPGDYIVVMHAFDAAGSFIGSACEAEVFTPGQRACVSVALSQPMIVGDGGVDLALGGGGGGDGGGGGSSGGDMGGSVAFTTQTSGVTTDLYQVWSATGGVVYIAGVQGVLLKTSDSGATWTTQTTNTTHDLEAVWGSSAADVWVAGVKGTLLHTTNGGTMWQSVSVTANDIYDVWGANANDVYIVGSGGMVKHYNGTTWASVNVSAGQTVINCVWGANGGDVYLFGANGLGLRGSASAGFNKLGSPTSDVLFYGWGSPDASDLWVPSNNAPSFTSASLWHSSDHGGTWQSQMSTVVLGAVWASNTGHAFVVGNEIFETTDSGAHWNSVSGAPAALFGIGGDPNGTAVWAVGQGGTILHRP